MPLFALLQAGCLVVFTLLLLLAAWQDLRTMRIADAVSVAIAGAFAVWALTGLFLGTQSLSNIGWAVACSVALFGAGAVAFGLGVFGGGDVKLLAAVGLFAGPALIPDFLMATAVAGGVLGLASLAGAPIGPEAPASDATVRARLRSGLPYGPAIAAGGLWVAGSLALR